MKFSDFKKLTKKEMIEWLSCHEYTLACFEEYTEEFEGDDAAWDE